MQRIYKIYKITEPDEIKHIYIGFTTQELGQRLRDHISHAQQKNFYLCNWIKKLMRDGKRPVISLVKETDEAHWREDEIAEIKRVRGEQISTGIKVLNILDGGEGRVGIPWPEESKKRLSEKMKGKRLPQKAYDTMKAKCPNGPRFGTKASPETLIKLRKSHLGNTSAMGHVLSDESKMEISKSKTKWKNKGQIQKMIEDGCSEKEIMQTLSVSRWAVYSVKYKKTLS